MALKYIEIESLLRGDLFDIGDLNDIDEYDDTIIII